MTELYEIEFTSLAESQIDDIILYLEDQVSRAVADKVKRGIYDAIEGLIEMPSRHGILQEVSGGEITFRRVLKWSYIIVFHVDDRTRKVTIMDVSNRNQDPQKLIDRLKE